MKRVTRFGDDVFIDDNPATVEELVAYLWRLQNWIEAETSGRQKADAERMRRGVPADPEDL